MNQKSGDFRRFPVAIVGLSEPDPLDDPSEPDQTETGKSSVFHEIKTPTQLFKSCAGRSTTNRQKSYAKVRCSGNVVHIRSNETGKSSIFHQNHQNRQKWTPYYDVPFGPDRTETGKSSVFSRNQNPGSTLQLLRWPINRESAKITRTSTVQRQCRAHSLKRNREIVDFHQNH